jgi:GTP-binding protein Era
MTQTDSQRCGYVALLGQPNAGKSTLLNAMVGQKLAGVSGKPQTTRNRILGISLQQNAQILFLDTPGIHRTTRKVKLNSMMNREAWSVIQDADVVLYLVDGLQGWTASDADFLGNVLRATNKPVRVLLTKVDRRKKAIMLEQAAKVRDHLVELAAGQKGQLLDLEPVLFSAKDPHYLKALGDLLQSMLPVEPWLFPESELTDRPQRFVVAELIREKIFRSLGEELPYQCAVKVESLEFKPQLVHCVALIVVGRASHKGMVIGRGGAKIKEIGQAARESLEQHLEQKVFLDLQVAVEENWVDNEALIAEYSSLENPPSAKG